MNEIIIIIASFLFFFVALIYSSVGKGGGSFYVTILHVLGFPALLVPPTALSLDIIVASLALYNYVKAKFFKIKYLLPFVSVSIPSAYLGGYINIDRISLILITIIALIIGGILLLIPENKLGIKLKKDKIKWIFAIFLSGIIGLNAGITGIGGGIFLSPILILFGLANPKQAAAAAGGFIVLNSISGLAGHITKGNIDLNLILFFTLPVLLGGFIGSKIGAFKLKQITIKRIIGLILIFASMLLILRITI